MIYYMIYENVVFLLKTKQPLIIKLLITQIWKFMSFKGNTEFTAAEVREVLEIMALIKCLNYNYSDYSSTFCLINCYILSGETACLTISISCTELNLSCKKGKGGLKRC